MATILIVDDRPSNREFLLTLLGYGGHRLLEAGDGARALEITRAERPDLVITDILMPTMDGFEFVQHLRGDPVLASTPVIFYTATYSAPEALALAQACGVDTVLPKPCEPQLILAAVGKALKLEVSASPASITAANKAASKAGGNRQIDEAGGRYVKDMQAVKLDFDEVIEHSEKLIAQRDLARGLSKKLSANVESMQRVMSRLSALVEVGMEMEAERDPAKLVQLFFAACCDIIESKYAAIAILDDQEKAFRHVYSKGIAPDAYRLGDNGRSGLFKSILSERKVIRDNSIDAKAGPMRLAKRHPAIRNILALPVASRTRVYGWIYFADKQGEKEFSAEDERLANIMATKLALLYENLHLYDDIQKHAAKLQLEVAERRRVQESLRESEAGLHRAQSIARLAHVVTGPDGSFESWSETFPALIGSSAIQMPKSTREWLALVHPDDRASFRDAAIESGRNEKRFEFEYRLRRADGTWIHVNQISEPLHGAAGASGRLRWFGTLQDVTERKRAAEALQASEAHFRALFNRAAVGIAYSDVNGCVVDVNPKFGDITGYAQEEALRLNIRELTHPDHIAESIEARAALLSGASPSYEREIRLIRKDRSEIWTQITTSVVSAGADGAKNFLSLIRDIAERKRMQDEALRAAAEQRSMRQLLDNIVDNIPTSVQVKSVQDGYRIMLWNKAAEAIYGLSRKDAVGRNVHDIWPKADAELFHAADLELIASGRVQDFPDRPAQTADRGEIRVHMRKVALSDATGKATHVLVIADDITTRLADEARLRESEARFRSLTELSADWYWEQDEEFRFVNFSGGNTTTGWGPDQSSSLGLRRWELPGATPASGSWADHKAMVEARMLFRNFEYKHTRLDGTLQYIAASGEPVFDASGRFRGYRGVASNIAARKQSEERIRRLNRVYSVLSGINSLIVRVRERDELFRESCRIAVEQGGFGMAWIGTLDPATLEVTPIAWSGMDAGETLLKASARADVPEGQGMVGRAIREKKPVITNDISADPAAGGPRRLKALQRGFQSIIAMPLMVGGDVKATLTLFAREQNFFSEEELKLLTELAGDISFALDHIEKQEKLNHLAFYDQVTGIANRALFQERLIQHVHAAQDSNGKLAVVVADIERFRMINDSLGRPAGDALLKQVAERLALVVNQTEIARIGADHFAIVLPEVKGRSEIGRTIEDIWSRCVGEPFVLEGTEIRIALKGGVSLFPSDGKSADALFRNAEAAWKNAKLKGERYLFHAKEMTARIAEKLSLENKLRQAIEKEEYVLHYQPKVDLDGRRIVGVEALIRWQSPERGLVPPGLFIPMLEETGLILAVGAWALRRAALDHGIWLKQGVAAPRIAVNVSQIQMRQRDFVEVVKAAIAQGSEPTGIDLEITESLLMDDIAGNIKKLAAVRDLGMKISIDDFGTGYSSLGYLAQLPVHTLKIDRSFIIKMLTDPNAMTLVQTIISLAHSLRLSVVAEGVEQEDQAKMLRLLRCDEMQGYLISKPVPMEELIPLLRKSD